ncbi:MAG: hypothetical protein NT033_03505 [Candidatus Omnitrophica bacterium]|nr:hypothetical protein [Candidatus Omnitrophota bacterium]
MMAKFPNLLINFIILSIAIIFSLLFIELILRVIDYPPYDYSPYMSCQETGFKLAPNIHQRFINPEFDTIVETNSLGLRDDEVTAKKGIRVLSLGDSFTFGSGVNRGEMFVDILEKKLGVEIINSGVPGFEIIHYLRYYKTSGYKLKPDLVVCVLFLGNDLSGNLKWKEEGGRLVSKEEKNLILDPVKFKIKTIIKILIRAMKLKLSLLKECMPYQSIYPEYLGLCRKELDESSLYTYKISEKMIQELADSVKASGADFFVVMVSDSTAVEYDVARRYKNSIAHFDDLYDLYKPEKELGGYFASAGIEYVNLVGPMREFYSRSQTRLYYPIDGHLTKEGNVYVAEFLSPVIKNKIKNKHIFK